MFTGITAFAYFAECDPLQMEWIGKSDQIIPYLAVTILNKFPGLAGLYVAGTYAGSLSTVSSGINSIAATLISTVIDWVVN